MCKYIRPLVLALVLVLTASLLFACGENQTPGTTEHVHTEVITKLGKNVSCVNDGLTEEIQCSVCNEILQEQKDIPATGHTEVLIPGKEATKTEDGLTDGKKCSVCNKILKSQNVIPATGVWNGKTAESFGGGTGTIDDPFIISNGGELAYLSAVKAITAENATDHLYFELTDNINLGGLEWNPIDLVPKYKSTQFTIDGKGYTISNFKIQKTGSLGYYGIFGLLQNATIKNLGVTDFSMHIKSNEPPSRGRPWYIGGIAGYAVNVTFTNCYTVGSISGIPQARLDVFYCGGIIGMSFENLTVSACYTNVEISAENEAKETADMYAGGIVGHTDVNADNIIEIKDCYSLGNISCGTCAGGIAGKIYGKFIIQNCYSTGDVTATSTSSTEAGAIGGLTSNDPYSTVQHQGIYGCLGISNVTAISTINSAAGSSIYCGSVKEFLNCYRYENQQLTVESKPGKECTTLKRGDICTTNDLNDPSFYTVCLLWDENIWDLSDLDFSSGKLPTLKGVGGQQTQTTS